VADLESRPARKDHSRKLDPDGTRVELMEQHSIDGKPAPSLQHWPVINDKVGVDAREALIRAATVRLLS